jgi:hypothetical protein
LSRYHSAKADANQPEIVKEFRRLGAYVLHIHRLKNCCDLVVCFKGQVVMVEVKMPGKTLTEGEDKFAGEWLAANGKYAVITTIKEAQGLVENMSYYGNLIKELEK